MPHPTRQGTRGFIAQQAELATQAYAKDPSEANAQRLHRAQLRLRSLLADDFVARHERRAQAWRPDMSRRDR